MPTYATITQLRDYCQLTSTELPTDEATHLLEKAEGDIDALGIIDRPISATTGRRFTPTTMTTVDALILQRATCAQAEYRRTMGKDFFIRAQYKTVSSPDYSTSGVLSYVAPGVYRELAGSGFFRLSTTTSGIRRYQPKIEDDFPYRTEREDFETG